MGQVLTAHGVEPRGMLDLKLFSMRGSQTPNKGPKLSCQKRLPTSEPTWQRQGVLQENGGMKQVQSNAQRDS